MNWLRDLVKPKVSTTTKREVAADVWDKCPSCGALIYTKELAENLNVCTHCGHHLRISLDDRFAYLLDDGTWQALDVPKPKDDPLHFKDTKKYSDRLKAARQKLKQEDAFRVGVAHIKGCKAIICALDFAFMAGSMSQHVGQAVVIAAQAAVAKELPLLLITASGGARMQEGTLSLMQMARTTAALHDVKEAKLPFIGLLTDPTTGGVTASFAMLGDILIGEPGALIGFTGPRVIEQTIGAKLPEGFQKSEYLLEHGMLDMVTTRQEQPEIISRLIRMLTQQVS